MNSVVRPRPLDDPALRLIVFHHAGGSAVAYFPLVHGIPADWDLVLMDLPGRGRQHRLPAVTDMATLVEVATREVLPWTTAPVALFGHSLGAIVAAEAARRLEALGVVPVWVGVSGRPGPSHQAPSQQAPSQQAPSQQAPSQQAPSQQAPSQQAPSQQAPSQQARYDLHSAMSDERLMRALDGNGGIPEQINEVPDFRDRFLRLVRDDLRAVESYRPAPGREPLAAPLTAFAGDRDPLAPPSAAAAWVQETRGHFQLRTFAGGHFYFLGPAFPGLAAAVTGDIERAAGCSGTPPTQRWPR